MGRRKQRGERYPCGKLKPERFPPALVRQMVEAGRQKIINAAFGTSIGRMRLEDKLTDAQVSAAAHFARFMGYHDRLIGGLARTSKSPNYQLGRAGHGPSASAGCTDCSEGRCQHCKARERASRDYDSIRAALTNAQWSVVYHTVLLDETCPWPRMPELKSGLSILADLYGYERLQSKVAA